MVQWLWTKLAKCLRSNNMISTSFSTSANQKSANWETRVLLKLLNGVRHFWNTLQLGITIANGIKFVRLYLLISDLLTLKKWLLCCILLFFVLYVVWLFWFFGKRVVSLDCGDACCKSSCSCITHSRESAWSGSNSVERLWRCWWRNQDKAQLWTFEWIYC